MKWRTIEAIVSALAIGGCGGNVSYGGGSETGFLACTSDSACGEGQACVAGACVADNGERLATVNGKACNDAVELPISDDVWWTAQWNPDLPLLPLPNVGNPLTNPDSSPAIVAKWTAPHDGWFLVETVSADFNAAFGDSPLCGADPLSNPGGASLLWPNGGFASTDNIKVAAGDAWFLSVQYLNMSGAPPPEMGTLVVHVSASP